MCFSGVRETRLARKGHEMGLATVGVVGQRTRSGLLRLAAGSDIGGGAHASLVSALPSSRHSSSLDRVARPCDVIANAVRRKRY